MLLPDYVELQEKNDSGFVVIGAGLPRTGTMSLRAALNVLLVGACHHMVDVFRGSKSVVELNWGILPSHPEGSWLFCLLKAGLMPPEGLREAEKSNDPEG